MADGLDATEPDLPFVFLIDPIFEEVDPSFCLLELRGLFFHEANAGEFGSAMAGDQQAAGDILLGPVAAGEALFLADGGKSLIERASGGIVCGKRKEDRVCDRALVTEEQEAGVQAKRRVAALEQF